MFKDDELPRGLTRRRFLKLGLSATALTLTPALARAVARPERALAFYNTHTGESIRTVFWADGNYVEQGIKDINWILRDFRSGDVAPMNTALIDLLHTLHTSLDTRQPFQIISGYRSPHTNAQLRANSNGVARHSLHMEAKATDVRVAGVSLAHLRDAAKALQGGGVGYYPGSDFVHVDVGRVRYW